jgi:hypothetical protein
LSTFGTMSQNAALKAQSPRRSGEIHQMTGEASL